MAINDITMTGNLVFDPDFSGGNDKRSRAKFRVASTPRHREPDGTWADGDTTFLDVVCFGALAENVAQSLGKGSPVIVTGRLQTRTVERAVESVDGRQVGELRKVTYTQIVAAAVGPDLSRVATQIRTSKGTGAMRQEEAALAEVAEVMESNAHVA